MTDLSWTWLSLGEAGAGVCYTPMWWHRHWVQYNTHCSLGTESKCIRNVLRGGSNTRQRRMLLGRFWLAPTGKRRVLTALALPAKYQLVVQVPCHLPSAIKPNFWGSYLSRISCSNVTISCYFRSPYFINQTHISHNNDTMSKIAGTPDYYGILQVSTTASAKDIKSAYRKLGMWIFQAMIILQLAEEYIKSLSTQFHCRVHRIS